MDDDRDTEFQQKFTQTLTAKTAEWLREAYPEASSVQDAVRMAISDARRFNRQFKSDR